MARLKARPDTNHGPANRLNLLIRAPLLILRRQVSLGIVIF
jgi:hypothetical protein